MKTTDEGFNFTKWLEELGHGSTNRIASERLREIVTACEQTGRKGSLTIKIEVKAGMGLAEVRASVTCKKPEPSLPGGAFYTDKEGNLLDEDPRQMSMSAKVLDVAPTVPLKAVAQFPSQTANPPSKE